MINSRFYIIRLYTLEFQINIFFSRYGTLELIKIESIFNRFLGRLTCLHPNFKYGVGRSYLNYTLKYVFFLKFFLFIFLLYHYFIGFCQSKDKRRDR